jgi:hypothetical protein
MIYVKIGVALALFVLGAILGHLVGYRRGRAFSKLEGGYCDVCHEVSPKFVYYKMTVVCEKCFASIKNNKDMKCRFCENPLEKCTCV